MILPLAGSPGDAQSKDKSRSEESIQPAPTWVSVWDFDDKPAVVESCLSSTQRIRLADFRPGTGIEAQWADCSVSKHAPHHSAILPEGIREQACVLSLVNCQQVQARHKREQIPGGVGSATSVQVAIVPSANPPVSHLRLMTDDCVENQAARAPPMVREGWCYFPVLPEQQPGSTRDHSKRFGVVP